MRNTGRLYAFDISEKRLAKLKPRMARSGLSNVHPVQIAHWRKAALEHLEEIFVDGRRRKAGDDEVEKEALYEEIGRLKVELDWLKKKAGLLE